MVKPKEITITQTFHPETVLRGMKDYVEEREVTE